MRRTVRPFVKEFKTRSPKSPSRQTASPIAEERSETKPLFLDLGDLASRHHDDGYEAALRAADAVFGKKIEAPAPVAAPVVAEEGLSRPPVGRVLPSLIETEPLPLDRHETPKRGKKPGSPRKEKKPAPPRVEKAEPAAPVRRSRPSRQTKPEQPSLPIERAPVKVAAEPKAPVEWRRMRRSIQLRWVLRTELKAGEKWKRRLPEAAR